MPPGELQASTTWEHTLTLRLWEAACSSPGSHTVVTLKNSRASRFVRTRFSLLFRFPPPTVWYLQGLSHGGCLLLQLPNSCTQLLTLLSLSAIFVFYLRVTALH